MTAEWHSAWKPVFDDIVATGPTAEGAVGMVLRYGEQQRMKVPRFYASTAITTAGWRRAPELQDPARIRDAIERNNRTASRILGALVANPQSLVSDTSLMVPTDLGKVPGWEDTDYLNFYFAWASGLNAEGTSAYVASFDDPVYADVLRQANDRSLSNEERWPAYKFFAEAAISKIQSVESLPDMRGDDGAAILLQLVDVEESLGCRAERLFADSWRISECETI